MKNYIWNRFLRAGLTACLMMGVLTGCRDEKKVDYEIEGITETKQPQGERGKSGLAQFEEEGVWKETWMSKTHEIDWGDGMVDVMGEIIVNATVTVPQTKQMSVVEVAEPEFDAAFKETIAENVFDSGEIYYGDPSHLPKKDLQEVQNYFDEIGEITISWESYPFSIKQLKQKLEDMKAALDNIENAGETYIPVEEYTVDQYIGTREGRLYCLEFAVRPGDGNSSYRRFKQITWSAKDLYEVCPEEFKELKELACSPWTQGNWVENQCEISEEEALKEAKLFVEQLGLDYPVYSYSVPLLWGTPPKYVTEESSSEGWGINGYVFFFDIGVDDISFVDYGMEEDYHHLFGYKTGIEELDKGIRYSLNARLQIYVTDQGVIKMVADNPLELVSVSEGVELLPLDTIKSIMKEEMNEHWDTLRMDGGSLNQSFDAMELIYFRVRDKENPGKYSYVPVWRLGAVTRDIVANEISIWKSVMINAIDGSFIDFYDET